MRIPRSRGAADGLLLMILGLWGAIIPFVGPYFDYYIGSGQTWHWSTARLFLSVVPGAAAFVGGFFLMTAALRPSAVFGAWLALAGGVWFVIGQSVSMLWNHGVSDAGVASGGTLRRAVEQIGWFYGLGAVTTALAAFALGRMVIRTARDAEFAAATGATAAAETAPRRRTGRFTRRPAEAPAREPVGTGAGTTATAGHPLEGDGAGTYR